MLHPITKGMASGIRNLTIEQIRQRIDSFDRSYVQDWNTWLKVRRDYPFAHTPHEFGRILRKWQACRPNAMRRCQADATHEAPCLEDLVDDALGAAAALNGFNLGHTNLVDKVVEHALQELWAIFANLSYSGRCRNGLAGVVGISKAVLLITEGRVGPAFDSMVRRRLATGAIPNAESWIGNLEKVADDINQFEQANRCTLREAVPSSYSGLHNGRLYDMILGPGTPDLV
jgi:hypothetical protein